MLPPTPKIFIQWHCFVVFGIFFIFEYKVISNNKEFCREKTSEFKIKSLSTIGGNFEVSKGERSIYPNKHSTCSELCLCAAITLSASPFLSLFPSHSLICCLKISILLQEVFSPLSFNVCFYTVQYCILYYLKLPCSTVILISSHFLTSVCVSLHYHSVEC